MNSRLANFDSFAAAWQRCQLLLLMMCLGLFGVINPVSAASESNEPAADMGLTQQEKTWLKNHQTIRVHNETSWGPFNYYEFGRPKGYSIEFMDLLAEKLGIQVQYITGPSWGEFTNMLANKDLDVMLNIVETEDRSKFILFTDPYFNNPPGIAVRDDNNEVRDLRDLNGRVLAIPKGFFYQETIEKHYPGIQLLLVSDQLEALKAVSFGHADATISGVAVQNFVIRNHMLNNLKVIGGIDNPLFNIDLRIGIRNDWGIFQGILQKALRSVTGQERDRLARRWLSSGLQSTQVLQLDKDEKAFLEANPVLRVHNELNWPPFNFNEQGKPKGYSIDVMNLIARKTGFRIEYISGPSWGDFLAMTKDRQLDVMLNVVNTPERREYIRFTRPFAYNPNVITSKKDQRYESIDQLNGKTVAITKGSFYEEVLTRDYPNIKIHYVKDVLDGLKAVSIGKANASLAEAAVVNHLIARNLMNDLSITGEVELGQPDLANLRIGVRSDWPVLQGILDRAIESISREEMALISKRWMGNENYVARPKNGLELNEAEKAWLANQPNITFCANPDWMPLEKIGQGGKHEGMVADYLNLMANQIGIGLTMVQTDSTSQSLQYAQNRRCDIMSAAFETPEAARQLNFTKPYLRLPLVIAIQENAMFVDGLKSLDDQVIAVPSGYGLLNKLQQDYPSLKVIEVDDITEGLRQVEEGRLFGMIGAIAPVGHAIREGRFINLKIGGRLDEDWKLAIAVRNDSPELLSMFNKATDYITEEERSRVFQRWVAVKFDQQVNYDLVWKIVAIIFVIMLGIVLWNWKLARLNRALKTEMGLRNAAEARLQDANDALSSKNRELSILSTTDSLTGLSNRLYIETQLNKVLDDDATFVVMLLDIDHFKQINDVYGHLEGDEVLKRVASVLSQHSRENDLIGRWGGEEFMLVLPNTSGSMGFRLAEKLRTAIAAEQFGEVDHVTASIGLAECHGPGNTARQLVLRADNALYSAKSKGRNRVIADIQSELA